MITVMAGVALVGFSGSLIKDTVKDALVRAFVPGIHNTGLPPPEPIEKPEATTVLVGEQSLPTYIRYTIDVSVIF